jgi:beta-mannosidase
MESAVTTWLPTPGTPDANQTFAQWCWSTQIFQSMTITAQIAFYRRGAGQPENNMGSLVWQLNDIWQGTSWSAIEYSGRWKVMNYGLSGIYSPVIINAFWEPLTEALEIDITSDLWGDVRATAQLTWYDWSGKALKSTSYTGTVPSLNNYVVYKESGLLSILPPGQLVTDVWLLMNVSSTVNGEKVYNEQYVRFVSSIDAPGL